LRTFREADNVEALVGRLTQAPELPLFDADDILDPHHVMNSHTILSSAFVEGAEEAPFGLVCESS
jgi:hypothetical protein